MNVIHQSQTMVQSPKNSSSSAHRLTPNVLLRDARKQNHWTQKQLADMVGVTALTVSRWERGETVPDNYARLKLCRVLRRIPEELWTEDSNDTNVLEETPPSGSIQAASHSTTLTSTSEEVAGKDHLPWYTILRRERDRRGWSQSQLAEQIGTDSKTVSRWERGLTFPQSWYRQRLMAVFGSYLYPELKGFVGEAKEWKRSHIEAKSSNRRKPRQMVLTPGSPSLERARKPPSLATQSVASCKEGGVGGRTFV